jgi:acetolactate decarboxylase
MGYLQQASAQEQHYSSIPRIYGAMKNVMRKGELFATIALDTVANKKHLYGLGPVEYLAGEIIIIDGRAYKSVVVNDTTMQVTETFDLKAPFFGLANIARWTESPLPDSVTTMNQLEAYLVATTKNQPRPYFFKLTAIADSADIHIVNLPKGTKVSSPEEAHQGQRNYYLTNKQVDLIGFFSTEHKAILTHHTTFMHIHLITEDRKQMGHLETISIKRGTAKLYLPAR